MATKAEAVWKALNGVVCVYKPAEVSTKYVHYKISTSLCKDLNNLETRPPEKYLEIVRKNDEISLNVRQSYADNVLCVGPRYQPNDVGVKFSSYLCRKSSGVLVVGINDGYKTITDLRDCFLTKCFKIRGILGQATSKYFIDDRIIAKGDYRRVDKFLINKILASYQAASQKRLFYEYEIDLKSQKGYDMIVKGLFRPKDKGTPIYYSFKCVEFEPPHFALEVNCINETELGLLNLIHELGISLKCYATCTGIQCIRYGCFTPEHALLKKHWTLEHIIENMDLSSNLLKKHYPNLTDSSTVRKVDLEEHILP